MKFRVAGHTHRSAQTLHLTGVVITAVCVALVGCNKHDVMPAEGVNRQLAGADNGATSRLNVNDVERSSDWPRMAGPYNNHSSTESGLNWNWSEDGPPRLWSVDCGTGYGMPIVVDSSVYLMALENGHTIVRKSTAANGVEEWVWIGPLSTYIDDNEFYSDGPYCTPCLEDGVLYGITAEGVLFALDPATGTELRTLNLAVEFGAPAGAFPWGSNPAWFTLDDRQQLVINVGGPNGAGVVCLDAGTFDIVWKSTNESRSYATPRLVSVGDVLVAVIFTAQNVIGLEARSGKELWRERFGVRGDPKLRANAVSPLVVPGDPTCVYLTAGPGAGTLKIELTSLGQMQSNNLGRRTIDSQFNNLVCDGRYLFGFGSKWNRQAPLRCVDRFTGDIMWDYASDLQRGASALVDGHLLLLGEEGHLAAVEASPDGPNVVAATAEPVVEGPCYTAPVVSGGLLFVRTERQLACFQLNGGSPHEDAKTASELEIKSRPTLRADSSMRSR